MKRFTNILYSLALGTAVILLVSCSSTLEVSYISPARCIADISAIQDIRLETAIHLSGNAVRESDGYYAQCSLQEHITSRLDLESQGFFRIQDAYMAGNAASEIPAWLLENGSHHGYPNITKPVINAAVLRLDLDLVIDNVQFCDPLEFPLTTIPYRIVYDPHTRIPSSEPDFRLAVTTVQTVSQPFPGIQGSGTLTATLTDARGNVLYRRSFTGLSYVFRNYVTPPKRFNISDLLPLVHLNSVEDFLGNLQPLPVTTGVIEQLICNSLNTIVTDISPHREKIFLELDESGDKRVVMLIKGQAFAEAAALVHSLSTPSEADILNAAMALECIGKFSDAHASYARALTMAPENALAQKGLARVSTILQQQKQLLMQNH